MAPLHLHLAAEVILAALLLCCYWTQVFHTAEELVNVTYLYLYFFFFTNLGIFCLHLNKSLKQTEKDS